VCANQANRFRVAVQVLEENALTPGYLLEELCERLALQACGVALDAEEAPGVSRA
jgi:hypothetical protein